MKVIKTIIVLIMVIGLPAGSWLFLQHGLDWRKIKHEELLPKTALLSGQNWSSDEEQHLKTHLEGRTTLLICDKTNSQIEAVIDQFKDAYTFQVKPTSDLSHSINTKLGTKAIKYAVIDTGMVIRQTYPDNKPATIVRLVEDLALLLPQRKSKDIKLRRKE